MLMRMYLQPELAVKHPNFLVRYDTIKPPLRPWDWPHCYLNGIKIQWDDENGLPYVPIRNLLTESMIRLGELLPVGWQERETTGQFFDLIPFGEWEQPPFVYLTIKDHWTGQQPSMLFTGLSAEEFRGPVQDMQCTVVLTRRGEMVHLELVLTPPDPRLAFTLFMMIRGSGADDEDALAKIFEQVNRLDE
jgi:hypothetical protein